MKHVKTFILLFLILCLISGCSTSQSSVVAKVDKKEINDDQHEGKKVAEEIEEKQDFTELLSNYETITLEEKDELKHVKIEYPEFSYDAVDKVISDKMEEIFNAETMNNDLVYDLGLDENNPYRFTKTFEEPIVTEDFVSIYFEDYIYTGGAHGYPYANPINFDLKNEQMIMLDDMMQKYSMNLEMIAALVAQKLIEDEAYSEYRDEPVSESYGAAVQEETVATEENFSAFTLSEDAITFYKPYYSIFPNSAGITGVEITWDEIEAYENQSTSQENGQENVDYDFGYPVEAEKTVSYVNEIYGFSLELPESWKDNYVVHKLDVEQLDSYFEPDEVIAFGMVEDGLYIGDLFTIHVLENVSKEEVISYYEEGSGFENFFASGNDIVLTYVRPGELPPQLFEELYIETGHRFSEMVDGDLPGILETVKFK